MEITNWKIFFRSCWAPAACREKLAFAARETRIELFAGQISALSKGSRNGNGNVRLPNSSRDYYATINYFAANCFNGHEAETQKTQKKNRNEIKRNMMNGHVYVNGGYTLYISTYTYIIYRPI